MIAVKIGALRIDWRESPEVFVIGADGLQVCSVILGYRLHGPLDGTSRGIIHNGMKCDFWRITSDANLSRILQSGPFIRRPVESQTASRIERKNLERVLAIVQCVRDWPRPMMFIPGSFRHRPDLVATIVEPFSFGRTRRWREVAPFIL